MQVGNPAAMHEHYALHGVPMMPGYGSLGYSDPSMAGAGMTAPATAGTDSTMVGMDPSMAVYGYPSTADGCGGFCRDFINGRCYRPMCKFPHVDADGNTHPASTVMPAFGDPAAGYPSLMPTDPAAAAGYPSLMPTDPTTTAGHPAFIPTACPSDSAAAAGGGQPSPTPAEPAATATADSPAPAAATGDSAATSPSGTTPAVEGAGGSANAAVGVAADAWPGAQPPAAGSPQEYAAVHAAQLHDAWRHGDWACAACGSHNFGRRKTCEEPPQQWRDAEPVDPSRLALGRPAATPPAPVTSAQLPAVVSQVASMVIVGSAGVRHPPSGSALGLEAAAAVTGDDATVTAATVESSDAADPFAPRACGNVPHSTGAQPPPKPGLSNPLSSVAAPPPDLVVDMFKRDTHAPGSAPGRPPALSLLKEEKAAAQQGQKTAARAWPFELGAASKQTREDAMAAVNQAAEVGDYIGAVEAAKAAGMNITAA
eukprot:gene45218-29944_t